MSSTDILELLVKVLIIALFFRLCVALIPLWVIAIIGFILLLQAGILDPNLVTSLYHSSSPLINIAIPFIVLLFAFYFIFTGLRGKR